MPNVLIRDVPVDVHAALQRHAASAGQSLQQFLSGELERLAREPTLEEVLARIESRTGGRGGLQEAVIALQHGREGRDRR